MAIIDSIINMFNDTVTVYQYNDLYESYDSFIIKDVYWYGGRSLFQGGKSRDVSDDISIIIPKKNIELAEKIKVGDYIVLGDINKRISSFIELSDEKTIIAKSIEINNPLTILDISNVVVTGV